MHHSGAIRAAGMRSHVMMRDVIAGVSDEAIPAPLPWKDSGLLRFARNDGDHGASDASHRQRTMRPKWQGYYC
jgi:hypothetical protein